MKLVVVSDTHRDRSFIKDLTNLHYDGDYFLHLGDSELSLEELSPFASVKGNVDYYPFPRERTLTINNKRILMLHGNDSSKINERYMIDNNIDIILFGHLHVAKIIELPNSRYIVNPGSLTRPRDGTEGTYCIIEINDTIKINILKW